MLTFCQHVMLSFSKTSQDILTLEGLAYDFDGAIGNELKCRLTPPQGTLAKQ